MLHGHDSNEEADFFFAILQTRAEHSGHQQYHQLAYHRNMTEPNIIFIPIHCIS
jgi:hypothetical protein